MSCRISKLAVHLLLIIIGLAVLNSEARPSRNFREERKYCGPRLTEQLHDFCELFYGPTDNSANWSNNTTISSECCESPCSILHIVLSYCMRPKEDAIRRRFGQEEIEYYQSIRRNMTLSINNKNGTSLATTTTIQPAVDLIEKNVRRKKHIRRHRRKTRNCKCRKGPEQIEKEKFLMERMVPEYIIGLAEFSENEPVIIANPW